MKYIVISKFGWFKIGHILMWLVWAILTILTMGPKAKECYTMVFGGYISYTVFNWFELIFMFGGGLVLLYLFVQLLNLKFWAYIIFEVIFITIIFVHLTMYFSCR